jgi:hypothetical protein
MEKKSNCVGPVCQTQCVNRSIKTTCPAPYYGRRRCFATHGRHRHARRQPPPHASIKAWPGSRAPSFSPLSSPRHRPCSDLCRRLGSSVSTTAHSPSCSDHLWPKQPVSDASGRVLSHAAGFLHELTIDRCRPCTPGPAITSRRTAQPRSPSASTPSLPTTSWLSCRHHPHCRWLPRCRQPSLVSPELPNRSQSVP